jgi:PAT family beta-lactamase induction signal transducer AmpG
MAVVLLTGFSCGLPNTLTGDTLKAWLTKAGVDLEAIGIFSVVALPYALKFLWSPLMDRFVPPFLGRRRGYMVITQAALILGIGAMAAVGVANAWLIGAVALLVAFFSASQDIAVDAHRTEILRAGELGAGAGLYILGYRVGLLASGSLALMLVPVMGWRAMYLLMAGVMVVGLVTTIFAPEPELPVKPPRSLAAAIVQPFAEFLRRRGAVEMLLFILIYKLDWMMVKTMMAPFILRALAFSEADWGMASGLGLFTTIVGATIGGVVITAIGIRRSLWTFGLLQGLAGISFAILAVVGRSYPVMVMAVAVENLCSGMATAAFIGFIMSLCDKRFTATQFALLTSLMALGGILIGTPAGWIIKQIGWPTYFVLSVFVAVPGLLLLLRFRHWQGRSS